MPDSGRTLIYDGLAQNDVDMANHRLINLDTSNLPPIGIPPSVSPPANQWLHDWDAISHIWTSTQPFFEHIGGNLTQPQQVAITSLGNVRTGTWNATPLLAEKVPTLDLIRLPQGDVNLNSKRLTHVAMPIDDGDAVNKGFMDLLLQGLNPKAAVRCATTRRGGLIGLLVIDGVQLADGDRVLAKDEGTYHNGIWIAHTGNWSRATDADTAGDLERAYVVVLEGDTNAGTSWVQINHITNSPPAPPDVVLWVLFATGQGSSVAIAGAGLSSSGNILNVGGTTDRIAVGADNVDIDSAYAGQSSITTLGIITDGTWHGDVIDGAHGGTGAINSGRTILLQGSFTTVDPFDSISTRSLRFHLSDNTALDLPTTGIVATKANVETFTNKRITRRVVSISSNPNPSINSDVTDVFIINNLSENITSMTTNLTGTPTDRQHLEIWIEQASGAGPTAHTIAWGSKWMASVDLPLPTVAIVGKYIYMLFSYMEDFHKWALVQNLGNII